MSLALVVLGVVAYAALAVLGAADCLRFPRPAWDAVKLDRGVVAVLLAASLVVWVLLPVLPWYWLWIRPRLRRSSGGRVGQAGPDPGEDGGLVVDR